MSRDGVLCVGRVYCDLVFTGVPRLPTLGTETFAKGLSLHPGGGAAITAAYLAALGGRAMLGAMLPAAPFGPRVAQELGGLDVDLALARQSDGVDPQITVAMATGGDRAFLTRDAGAAVPALTASDLKDARIGHLHIGELKTLAERPDLLELAREAGVTVSLDCGWHDGLTRETATLIEAVDVFLPNAEEMAQLGALGVTARGRKVTVVKRGAAGAEADDGVLRQHCPALPAEVVDTTGAGDAFNGGFLSAWLTGAGLEACLRAGVACGAVAVASAGGTAGAHATRRNRRSLAAAQ